MNQKLLTEFIGTFFLVTAVAFTGSPVVIGAVLAAMVYAGGHVSGAHYNPAVTLALYLRKKISASESLAYVGAQFCGAFLASLFFLTQRHTYFIPSPATSTSLFSALAVEAVFTFLLVRTILSVAVDSRVKGNQYFGVAIGAALFVGASAGGPISGGAFNPAVGIAPLLLDVAHLPAHLMLIGLYVIGPCAGAAAAAFLQLT